MKSVNPLLPFILCATSVFSEELDATIEDEEFLLALSVMADIERKLGQPTFEHIMATIARSVSKVAWVQLVDAANAATLWPTHHAQDIRVH